MADNEKPARHLRLVEITPETPPFELPRDPVTGAIIMRCETPRPYLSVVWSKGSESPEEPTPPPEP